MDSEILYKSVKQKKEADAFIDYYIIPESISASYCDLKCYGIKIKKTTLFEGGGKIIETKQISNIFYRFDDAPEFLDEAARLNIEPVNLKPFVEKYIAEGLDRARQKI